MNSCVRLRALAVLVVLGVVGFASITAVPAIAAPTPVITGVTLSGSSLPPGPTVTVTGHGLGHAPPGYPNGGTSCGTYTNNGDDYGAMLGFLDVARVWAAGAGVPPAGNCIGIVVQSWKPHRIVYTFGSAYGSFDDWFVCNGDTFMQNVKGAVFSGTANGLSPSC
jgi:hypothetical protein